MNASPRRKQRRQKKPAKTNALALGGLAAAVTTVGFGENALVFDEPNVRQNMVGFCLC